jgi:hypothetical protein
MGKDMLAPEMISVAMGLSAIFTNMMQQPTRGHPKQIFRKTLIPAQA